MFVEMFEEIIQQIRTVPNHQDAIFLIVDASVQNAAQVRDSLTQIFPGRWIGRGAEHEN